MGPWLEERVMAPLFKGWLGGAERTVARGGIYR
jgi:hypothetical protein